MSGVAGSGQQQPLATRAGRWQEDLDYLAREFPARHKDLYKLVPRERFQGEIAHILVSELSDS